MKSFSPNYILGYYLKEKCQSENYPTALLKIFCKIVLNSKIIDQDNNFWINFGSRQFPDHLVKARQRCLPAMSIL